MKKQSIKFIFLITFIFLVGCGTQDSYTYNFGSIYSQNTGLTKTQVNELLHPNYLWWYHEDFVASTGANLLGENHYLTLGTCSKASGGTNNYGVVFCQGTSPTVNNKTSLYVSTFNIVLSGGENLYTTILDYGALGGQFYTTQHQTGFMNSFATTEPTAGAWIETNVSFLGCTRQLVVTNGISKVVKDASSTGICLSDFETLSIQFNDAFTNVSFYSDDDYIGYIDNSSLFVTSTLGFGNRASWIKCDEQDCSDPPAFYIDTITAYKIKNTSVIP